MSFEQPRSLLTRASLLFRLRDWKDDESWKEFYRLYHRLVYGMARRSALTHDEAEDVVQDVFKRVAETIHNFEAQPRRGSFRTWLMTLTRWRIADKFRGRLPEGAHLSSGREPEAYDRTNTIERVPEMEVNDEAAWQTEWQRNVLDTALARIARKVPGRHFQAFDLYARQRWPVMKVARELGINAAAVYLISHRLTRQLKAEVERLKRQLG